MGCRDPHPGHGRWPGPPPGPPGPAGPGQCGSAVSGRTGIRPVQVRLARGRNEQPGHHTDHPDRPGHRVAAEDRRGDARVTHGGFLVLDGQDLPAHLGQGPASAALVVLVRPVSGTRSLASARACSGAGRWATMACPSAQACQGMVAPDLKDLHGVVRAEHVVQHDHPEPGQGGHPDRLPGLRASTSVHRSDRARSSEPPRKLLPSETTPGPRLYLPVSGSWATRSWLFERAQQPVHGGLGQPPGRAISVTPKPGGPAPSTARIRTARSTD